MTGSLAHVRACAWTADRAGRILYGPPRTAPLLTLAVLSNSALAKPGR